MNLVSLFVVVAAALAPARAEAMCGTPAWLGTPTGAKVPAKGSIYLYSESLRDRAPGGPIVAFTRISDEVARIDYATKADELEFKVDDREQVLLQIDRGWRRPAQAPRVVQLWHHQYSWTCSSADSLMIQIDQPAAAYRVRWQVPGKAAREWILPPRTDAGNINVLELGKINCGGTTIDPEELAQGGHLSLVAIRFDGSEVEVKGVPHEVSTAGVPTSEEGIGRAIHYTPGGEPIAPQVIASEPVPDFALHLFAIVLAIGGVLLVVRFRHRALKEVV